MKAASMQSKEGQSRPTINDGIPLTKFERPLKDFQGNLTHYALCVGKTVLAVCENIVDTECSSVYDVEVKVGDNAELYLVPGIPSSFPEADKRRIVFWELEGYTFAVPGHEGKTFLASYDIYIPDFRNAEKLSAMKGLVVLIAGEYVFLHKDEGTAIRAQNVEGRIIIRV